MKYKITHWHKIQQLMQWRLTSSTIDKAAIVNFNASGTRLPNIAITPNTNAISVVVGIAHPRNACELSSCQHIKTTIGITIPPIAPMTGKIICDGCDNSPIKISRLISSDNKRKNKAINPSLIHASKG